MRFFQFRGALVAAHFDGLAADFHFDGISIELAVASRTSCTTHGVVLLPEARAAQ